MFLLVYICWSSLLILYSWTVGSHTHAANQGRVTGFMCGMASSPRQIAGTVVWEDASVPENWLWLYWRNFARLNKDVKPGVQKQMAYDLVINYACKNLRRLLRLGITIHVHSYEYTRQMAPAVWGSRAFILGLKLDFEVQVFFVILASCYHSGGKSAYFCTDKNWHSFITVLISLSLSFALSAVCA